MEINRKRFYIFGFLLLTFFDTFSQFGFKLAAIHSAPVSWDFAWIERVVLARWIYFSVAGYIGAFFTYLTLLRYAPVGPAFAASHFEIVTVLILSFLLLGESLNRMQLLGALCIVAGILVFASGEKEHPPSSHIS